MSHSESPPSLSDRQQYALLAVIGLIALIIGLLLAPTIHGTVSSATESSSEEQDSIVAVVTIDGPINSFAAESVEEELAEARSNESVEAVVLEMDTPGGAPAASERMYAAIERTNEEMPVIASVQEFSASGGYYAMLGAEDIYANPTSIVGSVGVASSAPQQSPPIEGPTGPDKQGSNVIQDLEQIDLLDEVFLNSVMEERGDRLELSREEVGTAQVFLGVEAADNGFVDEIGSIDDATAEAAERAGLDEYVVDRRDDSVEIMLPIFVQTDEGIVEVHDENPGYGDIEPVQYAYLYEPAIPHVDTIEELSSVGSIEDRSAADIDDTEEATTGDQP